MSTRNSEVGTKGQDRGVSLIRTLLQLAVVALAYWLAAMVSLRLALVHGQVTPIWPPTGIALVAILVFGRRVWPSIFLGALAVTYMVKAPHLLHWWFGKLETQILTQLPPDLPAADRERLHAAFRDVDRAMKTFADANEAAKEILANRHG